MTAATTSVPNLDADGAAGRLKNPWWTVLAMVFALAVGTGALGHYVLGALIKVLSGEFGWSRAATSSAVSLYFGGAAVSFAVAGALVDRWDPRRVAIVSMGMLGGLLFMLQFCNQLWQFYLVLLCMGLFGGGGTLVPFVKAISAGIDRRRGLALGLGASGAGLGGLFLPFYMSNMLEAFDWRTAVAGLALVVLLLPLPGAWLTLPGRQSVQRERAATQQQDMSYSVMLRSRSYWTIAGSVVLVSLAVNGIIVHAVPLLTDRGMSAAAAATAMGAVGITSALSRVVAGYLMDRFFAPYVTAAAFMAAAVASVLLIFGGTGPAVYVALILIAFTLGSEIDAMNYLISRYLPGPVIGKAVGLTFAVFTLAASASIAALGKSHDVFGSYTVGLIALAVLSTVAALLVASLGPYPKRSDEHGEKPMH